MNAPDRLASLRVNPDWANLPLFDRSKWQRVRFGDVVENLNETVDPTEAGIERYIGLEHLEPGSLHIRSWGNVSDGTTFTRRARNGQVLFGKRRAYQRKVAVASFEAVVSGDIYVLAPGNRLVGDLLPFLCMSDRFFNHAVGTSAGSLSPRTNWSSLANFEFELPPLEQQEKILRILYSLEDTSERLRTVESLAQDAATASFLQTVIGNQVSVRDLSTALNKSTWPVKRAAELVDSPITKGATPSASLNTGKATIPFIKVYNLTFSGKLDFTIDPTFVEQEIHQGTLRRSRVQPGDVLMNIVGPPLGKTAVVPDDFGDGNINQAIVVYRIGDPDFRMYFAEYLRSQPVQSWFSKRSKKTSGQQNLTLEVAQDLPVPIPTKKFVKEAVNTGKGFSRVQEDVIRSSKDVAKLRAAILNGLWKS